jgi:hypothetical protein
MRNPLRILFDVGILVWILVGYWGNATFQAVIAAAVASWYAVQLWQDFYKWKAGRR